MPTLVITIKA